MRESLSAIIKAFRTADFFADETLDFLFEAGVGMCVAFDWETAAGGVEASRNRDATTAPTTAKKAKAAMM